MPDFVAPSLPPSGDAPDNNTLLKEYVYTLCRN